MAVLGQAVYTVLSPTMVSPDRLLIRRYLGSYQFDYTMHADQWKIVFLYLAQMVVSEFQCEHPVFVSCLKLLTMFVVEKLRTLKVSLIKDCDGQFD